MGLYVADLKSRQGGCQRLCGTQRQCRRTTSSGPCTQPNILYPLYWSWSTCSNTRQRLDADRDLPGRPVQDKLKIGQYCSTVLSTVGLELERLKHESINGSTLCTTSTVRSRIVDGLMLSTEFVPSSAELKGAQRIPSADSAAQSM